MTRFGPATAVKCTVLGYDEADEEEVDDVEDANTPDDLPRGFGDFFPRVFGFGSSQSSQFGSAEGK